ncbi:uncharacterized protein Z519_12805, partial [Cladophialophora bantiana CBS 173.52]
MHRLFGDGPVRFHSREQEEGIRAVLRAETPVTIVLPTGGGKTLLAMLPIMLKERGSMINFAQESERGGRAGETVNSLILVTQRAAEIRLQRRHLSVEAEVMARFIHGATCRRYIMSEYLDGPVLTRSYLDDPEWIRCDHYDEGEHEMRLRTQQDERERQFVEEALGEMTIGYTYYWLASRERDRAVYGHRTQDYPWTQWNRSD